MTYWNLEYGPKRSSDGNRTIAVFYDGDRRIEVSIVTSKLRDFGEVADDKLAKEGRAERVLRAMLDAYEVEHEIAPGQLFRIDENDVNLTATRSRVTAGVRAEKNGL